MSKVIFLEKTDFYATVTTWIYCHMHMLYNAEKKGLKAYINWSKERSLIDLRDDNKFNECPNMFEWYFKQPHEVSPTLDNTVWTWEFEKWGANIDTTDFQLISEPLSVIKEFYKKNLHFNDVVNARGQALVDKYGIDFSNTIGLTWRGTDGITDGRPRLSIGTYFPFIDDILKENPDARIMCSAEEETILDPLLDRYPNAFKIEEFYSSPFGHSQNPERFSPMSGFERGLQPALMVWLFSKCAYYIKNRSSTGAVASWLSDGKIINLAHQETLSYLKIDDQVEIEGKLYPLYR